jgi:hypothetical protein
MDHEPDTEDHRIGMGTSLPPLAFSNSSMWIPFEDCTMLAYARWAKAESCLLRQRFLSAAMTSTTLSGAVSKGVVDGKSMIRPHSLGHEVLRFGIDHAVFFGNQKPRRL